MASPSNLPYSFQTHQPTRFSQISIFKKILRIKYILIYMANIKVVDVNEADKQEETTAIEDTKAIEEAQPEEEILNEVVEEAPTMEEVQEEDKPKPKAKPKPSDRVDCNTCGKNLSYKNYRYRHEKLCTAEPKPVKPQAKPKAKVKMMPKPTFKTVEVNEQPQEEQQPEPKPVVQSTSAGVVQSTNPPVIKQQIPQMLQPSNPLMDITNHYQLLQNQYIQQKKEKYNNLCQNMFAPKSKKR